GLVTAERIEYGSGSAPQVVHDRVHTYDGRHVLRGSKSSAGLTSYTLDPVARLTAIRDAKGTRSITRSGQSLVAGNVTYALDTLGRVVKKGDLTLTYGPDSQLASASRADAAWTFAYDHEGHRVLKDKNGVHVAAYLA